MSVGGMRLVTNRRYDSERKLKTLEQILPKGSWFLDYLACWPTAEPPKSFILFSAMAMMGAAIGRRLWFDMDVHKVYPLMNLLLIGPSGTGKSTALRDMALDNLILALPEQKRPQVITGKSTKEALHEDLCAKPHSIVLASELSNFFSKEKYNEGMIPYITDLLDLAPVSVRTKGGGAAKIIQLPEVAIMGGSTKDWLQDQLPSTAVVGGFLPRFFIIKEDFKGQLVADPKRALTKGQQFELENKRLDVISKFRLLTIDTQGIIDFLDYDAADTYAYWYQTTRPDTGILAPFAARAGAHVIRISMLLAVSCDRLVITAEDVRAAIELFGLSMSKLAEVIVPMSFQGKLYAKIMDHIGSEMLSDIQIRRAMRNYCSAQDTDKMLTSLLSTGEVIFVDGKFKRGMK